MKRFSFSFLIFAVAVIAVGSLPARARRLPPSGLFGIITPITEPTPTNGDYFGEACNSGTALSEDGKTALVAAPVATVGTTAGAGKAYIFHFANGQWTVAQEIDDPDAASGNSDEFGMALALNGDGTVALIGSVATVNGQANAGKAYLYTLSNGTWVQSHEFDDPTAAVGDEFSRCDVALSTDGKTAGIASLGTTVNGQTAAGEAYIYAESNGTWSQTAALPDPDDVANDEFGAALAESRDGKSVLIGSSAGKAFLYTLANGSWSQSHEFDAPVPNDGFGNGSVALSANGETAGISAYWATVNGQSYAGEAYIYAESNGAWTQTAAIPDPDAAAGDGFGFPVAVSAGGTSALFGSGAAVNGQANAGKAYLYTLSNGTWVQSHEFDDPAATANDDFGVRGAALSGDGETAFLSAPYTTVNSVSNAGAAYLYQSPDDVSLAFTAMPASVNMGHSVALDATVSNTDAAVTAYNVTFSDTLPAGLTYTSSTAAGGSCTANGQTVTCTLTSLAPGAMWPPTIIATANMIGSLSDTASVTSNEPDPATANNAATASITVVDTPPTATNSHFSTPVDTAYSGQLQASDPDSGQSLTYSIVSQPSHGTVTITNASTGAYTYTPAAGYVGSDSFTFKVNDGYKDSNTATVSATVTDTAPVAQNASYTMTANGHFTGQLQASAASSSQTLTYSIVSGPAHGSVSLSAGSGQFTYVPDHDYTGTDRFTFKANDGTLDSNTATVTLKVVAGPLAQRSGTGGGAFGPWGLALLAALALLIALVRRKSRLRGPDARGRQGVAKVSALALGLVLAGSVLFTATPARAGDAGPWYAGVQANVIQPAGGRNSATAGFKGWTVLFGRHVGRHFAVEIERASYKDYPETLRATANWVNWGLRGLYFPWRAQGAFAPFVFAGLGHQYEYRGDNSEPSNNSASLGLGFTSQPWSAPVAIRADLELQHGFGGGYTDRIFSLGLVFPFGGG